MDTELLWHFLLTVLISAAGGFLAKKLRLSAPLLVGGLIAVALFSITTSMAHSYKWVSFILQIISGGLIGTTINRKNVLDIKKLFVPAIFMVSGMFLVNVLLGNIIYFLTSLDIITACLSTVPGGVSETVIIAETMGAEVPTVAVMQTIRQASSLLIFPNLIRLIVRHKKKNPLQPELSEQPGTAKAGTVLKPKTHWTWPHFLLTCAIATAGGFVGKLFPNLPASTLIFSMLATSAVNIGYGHMYIHPNLKKCAQILSGVYVGSKITHAYFLQMQKLIVPIIVLILGFTIFFLLLGWLMSKIFHLELASMLFACTPAGASDIALVAGELTDNTSQIAVLHIVRLLCVLAVFPSLIGALATLY